MIFSALFSSVNGPDPFSPHMKPQLAQPESAPSDEAGALRGQALAEANLRVGFGAGAPIVDGVDIELQRGRILCLVGESGSGKSLTALSLMRLLPPHAHLAADSFVLDGENILDADEDAMNAIRGNRMAMVFQEPMTALNPVMTVGDQVTETLMVHQGLTKEAAFEVALEMFRRVQIPAPGTRLRAYPHQLSG